MTASDHTNRLYDRLKQHAKKVQELGPVSGNNEEQTKARLILPFVEMLGFSGLDIEFEHPIGATQWSVDYALIKDSNAAILVEAKPFLNRLGKHERNQLKRYLPFESARFGLLTNGAECVWFKKQDGRDVSEDDPFLIHDLRTPSRQAAEWLVAVSHENFDAENLGQLAKQIRTEERLWTWVNSVFVDGGAEDADLTPLLSVVGLDSTETPLLRETAKRVWQRTLAEQADSSEITVLGEEYEVTEPGEPLPQPQRKLAYNSIKGEFLDLGDGRVLEATGWQRACRIAGGDWQVLSTATKVTTELLGLLLNQDARRHDEKEIADQFGFVYSESKPTGWVENIPGFPNIWYEKGIPNKAKVQLLCGVVDNLQFDPPDDSPFNSNPVVEWWLVDVVKRNS